MTLRKESERVVLGVASGKDWSGSFFFFWTLGSKPILLRDSFFFLFPREVTPNLWSTVFFFLKIRYFLKACFIFHTFWNLRLVYNQLATILGIQYWHRYIIRQSHGNKRLSISDIADVLGFPHTAISRVYRIWSGISWKKGISNLNNHLLQPR